MLHILKTSYLEHIFMYSFLWARTAMCKNKSITTVLMHCWFWKSGILYYYFFRGQPQEMPHYIFCPRQKNNFQDFQNQRCIGIFMSQREGERERASERENKSADNYISELPGPKWKIRELQRKERYSMWLTLPRGS
jgi:hypothetical protein